MIDGLLSAGTGVPKVKFLRPSLRAPKSRRLALGFALSLVCGEPRTLNADLFLYEFSGSVESTSTQFVSVGSQIAGSFAINSDAQLFHETQTMSQYLAVSDVTLRAGDLHFGGTTNPFLLFIGKDLSSGDRIGFNNQPGVLEGPGVQIAGDLSLRLEGQNLFTDMTILQAGLLDQFPFTRKTFTVVTPDFGFSGRVTDIRKR